MRPAPTTNRARFCKETGSENNDIYNITLHFQYFNEVDVNLPALNCGKI